MPEATPGGTDIFEILHTTRAMRRLKPDPVPDDLIRKILLAGQAAANGGNTQRWRFLVLKDPAKKGGAESIIRSCSTKSSARATATSPPPPGSDQARLLRQHGGETST